MMSEIRREKELFTPSVAKPLAQGEISGLQKKVGFTDVKGCIISWHVLRKYGKVLLTIV